ncbi:MAG TPA: carboxypeptidase regulatory-like domain-containing protein, partial [Gemmatimonadaceae bacterium]|nr:carboxypeptidase regulatory-like domain-containing protein [Gemmatimonadaceae bacterium]
MRHNADFAQDRTRVITILTVLALFAAATISGAQAPIPRGTIQGIAVDPSGAVVSGVEIQLGDIGIATQLTHTGQYRFDSVAVGSHSLVARKLGFQSVILKLEVLPNAITNADLVMKPATATLAPVTVNASSTGEGSAPSGFVQRAATGEGTFFTESDIARIRPKRVSDLMRRVPGVTVAPDGEVFSGRGVVTLKTTACEYGMPVFIDNVQVGGGDMGDPESLNDRSMNRKPDFMSPTSTSRSPIDG